MTDGAFQDPEVTEHPTPVTTPDTDAATSASQTKPEAQTWVSDAQAGVWARSSQLHGCVCDTCLSLYSQTPSSPRSPRQTHAPLCRDPCGLSWVQGKLRCLFRRKALAVVEMDTYVRI